MSFVAPDTIFSVPQDEDIRREGLNEIRVKFSFEDARTLKDGRDPGIVVSPVEINNISSGESTVIDGSQIAWGFDIQLQPDKFYQDRLSGFIITVSKSTIWLQCCFLSRISTAN
jgi:hypothetical protein